MEIGAIGWWSYDNAGDLAMVGALREGLAPHRWSLQENGTVVIFVSHHMHLVRSMCDSALLLTAGRIYAGGATSTVISAYEQWLAEAPIGAADQMLLLDPQDGLVLNSVEIVKPDATSSYGFLDSRRPLRMRICYHAIHPQLIGRIDVRIVRDDGTLCCTADSTQSANGALHDLLGTGTIELTFAPAELTTGT